MRYHDMHPALRWAVRNNDLQDFFHTDAHLHWLIEAVCQPLAGSLEKELTEARLPSILIRDVLERVLTAVLPARSELEEQARLHEQLVRQLERTAYVDPAQLKIDLGADQPEEERA